MAKARSKSRRAPARGKRDRQASSVAPSPSPEARGTVDPGAPAVDAPVAPTPPTPSWLVVDRIKLAEILDISDNTISDWLKAGMPAIERGGRGKPASYDAIACLKWYRENKVGRNALEIAKTDSARRDVMLKDIKIALEERRLVPSADVIAMGQRFVKAWTAIVRSIPKQAKRSGVIDTAVKEKQLADICRRALDEISRWNVPEEFKASEDNAADPAA